MLFLLDDVCYIGSQSCPILFNDHGMAVAGIMFFAFPTTKAFSEKQCTARYGITNNVFYILYITIGDEKILAHLRLISPTILFL